MLYMVAIILVIGSKYNILHTVLIAAVMINMVVIIYM